MERNTISLSVCKGNLALVYRQEAGHILIIVINLSTNVNKEGIDYIDLYTSITNLYIVYNYPGKNQG